MNPATIPAIRSDLADVPVRWSWLSHFLSSALHAREQALHGKEPTPAMKLGTAGHVVTFEQPYEVFRKTNPKTGKVWNRSAKAWDEDEARCKADGIELLTVAEYDKACRIRDALRGNRDAERLLFGPDVVREQPIHWVRRGRACSSRPDARKPGDWIADLKCVRTARPDRFASSCRFNGYPGQLRYYREADCFEMGRHVDSLHVDLYVVAIEPFAPYAVTVFELDPTAREHGDRTIATCWELLTQAEATNYWGGYAEGVVPLVIPANDEASIDWNDIDPPDPEDRDDEEAL